MASSSSRTNYWRSATVCMRLLRTLSQLRGTTRCPTLRFSRLMATSSNGDSHWFALSSLLLLYIIVILGIGLFVSAASDLRLASLLRLSRCLDASRYQGPGGRLGPRTHELGELGWRAFEDLRRGRVREQSMLRETWAVQVGQTVLFAGEQASKGSGKLCEVGVEPLRNLTSPPAGPQSCDKRLTKEMCS